MFTDLPPFSADEALLHMIGAAGGACDGSEAEEIEGSDDATVAAGWPFVGQFVAHDITADRSPLRSHAEEDRLRNFRTPRLNLECVYGGGPVGSPYLYERDDPAKLLLGPGGNDVPRNQEGLALIGDPRNDVHLFVNQLHVAFLRAHNLLVDRLREDGVREADIFDEARRATMWHYQWILLHDYLPSLIGAELDDRARQRGPALLRDRRRALHPVRVRRRGVPLRPQPDPPPLPDQRDDERARDVPRPDGLRRRAARARRRLGAALRPARASRRRSARSGWTAGCPRA